MNLHTTINGFNRAAKQLAKQLRIPHNQAQEKQARLEGYANYNHAQRTLRNNIVGYNTTFSMGWQKEPRSWEGGSFEASVWTKKNPPEILSPSARGYLMKLKKERNKSFYRIQGFANGEDQAKWYVGQFLRFMQFCDLTNLTPGKSPYYNDRNAFDICPWADHRRHWWDSIKNTYVISDEPYPSQLSAWKGRTQEWGDSQGLDTLELEWGSVYSDSTSMVLFSQKGSGIDLEELNTKLNLGAPPIYPEEP